MSPCKIVCSCKSFFVQKRPFVHKYFCATLSLCNFISSCKSVFVQKYLRAILCTRTILYARANLTATHACTLYIIKTRFTFDIFKAKQKYI